MSRIIRIYGDGYCEIEEETEMSKHSPGPWTIEGKFNWLAKDGYWIGGIADADEEQGGRPGQDHANAHLICTAPEMLAMLKRLSTISTFDDKWDNQILELIKKAEGKNEQENH
jgi:hypothetical protein